MGGSAESEPPANEDVGADKDDAQAELKGRSQFDFSKWREAGCPLIVEIDSRSSKDRERASEFFASALTASWRRGSETALWVRVAHELNRLSWVFPDLYEQTLEQLGLDEAAWRKFRRFLTEHLSDEEVQSRQRGIFPSLEGQ